MSDKLTVAQEKAIEAGGSILVSAAAGSGKTSVLTKRVIRKLTDETSPVSADKLLIVTFTNAAALEMRTRIENALLDEIEKQPANDNLIEQYHLFQNADISTIDSFCINLVRENFENCGVEQNFSVTNGSEMSEVCDTLLSDIIEKQFENKTDDFMLLLQLLDCEKDDNNLKEIIKTIYRYSNSQPFPELFIDSLKTPYITDFKEGHIWFDSAFDCAANIVAEANLLIEEIQSYLPNLSDDFQKFADEIDNYKNMFDSVQSCANTRDFERMVDIVFTDIKKQESVPTKLALSAKYKHNREQLKKLFLSFRLYFSNSVGEINGYLQKYKGAVILLTDLVKEYLNLVLEAFIENNTLAFYHTEQMALKLLCDIDKQGNIVKTPIAKQYIDRYEEVMVDEYQDVNDLQELMFNILSDDEKNLFVVGDIKQSIYRFRGSNPKNFLNKKNDYVFYEKAGESDKTKIILSENFRSRKCVCDFVNFIFEKIMRIETGGIPYGEEEVLNPSAKFADSDDEFTDLILVKNTSESEEAYDAEAQAIADYILNLIASRKQIKRKEGTSDIKYGDICVLFESTNKAPILAKALSREGIPVSFYGDDFCKSPEISMVLSLMAVVDNPLSNVDLLTVLMSPLFSFTPDDIAKIRQYSSDAELYRSVLTAANNGNDKCIEFVSNLELLSKKSAVMSISGFVSYLIYETEVFSIISSLQNSNSRKKNLYLLINMANNYTGGSVGDFADFIRSLPNDSFVISESGGNAVKIMTMHKSKGLQFPVCILSNLSKKFFSKDREGEFILADKNGLAFKPFDEERFEYFENVGYEVAKNEIKQANVSEKIRLLYVAMTRAEEKLVLVVSHNRNTSVKGTAKSISRASIPSREIINSQSFAKLILSACLLHPDADTLRNLSETDIPAVDTNSKLKVITYDFDKANRDDKQQEISEITIDYDLVNQIKQNIEFKYKNEFLSEISAKTSVSELTHNNDNAEFLFADRPAFMNEKGISPAQRGTAVHKIMQFIDFAENIDVDSEIERLEEWQYITPKEAEIADRAQLNLFFNSKLFGRILKSEKVLREMRFLTEICAGEITDVPDDFYDRKIIVQGAVDLLFFEDDEIVIVDFKTDRVKDPEELVNLYSGQLDFYAKACAKKFGMIVKEKIIYSFNLSREIKLNP